MANTALKKITTRAKQIRKKQPGIQWKTAIKKAGAEYRSGKKVGAVKKKTRFRQTGTSSRIADQQRRAKRPGKRKSASGRVYYERRKNRSDVPFALTGISTPQLNAEMKKRIKEKLSLALLRRDLAFSRRTRKVYADQVRELKSELRKLS